MNPLEQLLQLRSIPHELDKDVELEKSERNGVEQHKVLDRDAVDEVQHEGDGYIYANALL